MTFDVQAAKQAGYSDQEIDSFLKKPKTFDKKAAEEAGYSKKEIASFLEERRKQEYPHGVASFAQKHPAEAATGAALTLGEPIEQIAALSSPGGLLKAIIQKKISTPLTDAAKEASGINNLSEEGRNEASVLNFIASLIPIERLLSLGGKGAKSLENVAGGPAKAVEGKVLPSQAVKDFTERSAIMSGSSDIPPPRGGSSSPQRESDIINKIIGENTPISQYEVAEEAIKEINPTPKILKNRIAEISPQLTSGGKSLTGRVAQTEKIIEKGGNPFGVTVKVENPKGSRNLSGRVHQQENAGSAISNAEFESDAVGGNIQNTAIRDLAQQERQSVSQVYKQAEENYENINSIADETLVDELRSEIIKIRQSLKPNTAESSVLKTMEDILDHYITRNGVSVKQLIRTSDSISGMANYELPFTGPKDILKRVANSLDRAAIRAIENNGGNAELQRIANRRYGEWANKFANDEISPYLERTVRNPEKLFRDSISNEGVYRAVESALHDSPRAKELTSAMARRVAEQKMGKFASREVGSSEYNKALRDLRALIGEQRANAYDAARRAQSRVPSPLAPPKSGTKGSLSGRVSSSTKNKEVPISSVKNAPRIRITPQNKEAYRGNKLEKLIEKISHHSKLTPEKIKSNLKTRSGIKELKRELSPRSFEILVRQEARSILQEGKIQKNFSGDQLYQVLNDERNFEIFTEILGKDEALALKEASFAIGKNNLSFERISNLYKTVLKEGVKATLGVKALRIILSLIV